MSNITLMTFPNTIQYLHFYQIAYSLGTFWACDNFMIIVMSLYILSAL
uniref:Uncharacterized protein n=1 Tax=Anguilla anguilla TaxID=7936 RepID=A0A0E9PSD5_ANGAN